MIQQAPKEVLQSLVLRGFSAPARLPKPRVPRVKYVPFPSISSRAGFGIVNDKEPKGPTRPWTMLAGGGADASVEVRKISRGW